MSLSSVVVRRASLVVLLLFIGVLPAIAGTLDIDGNGKTDPASDGLLILRYQFGFRGPALVAGALASDATRTTPAAIESYLASIAGTLDVDGNGKSDPLTDGILIQRYLSGYSGPQLTAAALGAGATRTTPEAIQAYLVTLGSPQVFASAIAFAPNTIFSGDSTVVTVAIAVAFKTGTSTLDLVATDASGVAAAKVLTLYDDGDLAKGDDIANDGVFHNKLTLAPTDTKDRFYIATDQASGQHSVVSRLPVVAHLTTTAVSTTLSFNASIDSFVKTEIAAGKPWTTVRQEVLDRLVANPTEVKLSGLSDNGDGVWWVTKDEVLVVVQSSLYGVSVRSGQSAQQYPRYDSIPPALREQPVLQPDFMPAAVIHGTKGAAPLATNTVTTDSNRGLVLSPYAFSFEAHGGDEGDDVAKVLNDSGIDTIYKANGSVAVEDFKNLGDYGVIAITSHGDNYFGGLTPLWISAFGEDIPSWVESSSQVVVLTGVKLTAANKAAYETDLKTQRLVLAGDTLAITPAFIKAYAGNLPNSFVYVGSCRSAFNTTMSDAFRARGAKTYVGYSNYVLSDFAFAHGLKSFQELTQGKTTGELTGIGDVNTASQYLERYVRFGAENLVIVSGLKNGTFETGNLTGWTREGDTRIITQLGPLTPPQGTYMSIISTGLGSVVDSQSRIYQKFLVPSDATRLKLRYNIISEEPMEFVGSSFDDKFEVAITVAGGSRQLLRSETVNTSVWTPISGINFAGGDSTVFQTGWKDLDIDATAYRGKTVTFEVKVYDVGDSLYDTAAVVDNIRIATVSSPVTSTELAIASAVTGATQIVSPALTVATVKPNTTTSVDLNYTTANPTDATLSGLGMRLHFNSSRVTFDGVTNVLGTGLVGTLESQADSSDADGDPSTDAFVFLAWADVAGAWPGTEVVRLATANFTARAGAFGAATFKVTALSAAADYSFSGSSTALTIVGLTATPSPVRIGATKAGAAGPLVTVTPAQDVTVNIPAGAAWTVTADQPWLQIVNGAGTGSAKFKVGVSDPGNVLRGATTATATLTITAPTIGMTTTVPVNLAVHASESSAAPVGSFDTPTQGVTGLQGSLAVTGWTLDDVGIDRVELWRDAVGNEPAYQGGGPGHGKVFIANATFIDGARPDVESAFTTMPRAARGGWGYLMLTWGLANQGNGTYTLYAFAYDVDGHISTLGTKRIGVDNAHAARPFGSIDTPDQGATVSGAIWNFGWALTPNPNSADPRSCTITNGNVQVAIDAGPLVNVNYGDLRPDIASGFPGFSNGTNAGGAYYLDTTTLSNGVHQIGWFVTDSCGRADGIGSRFFTVLNGSAGSTASGSGTAAATRSAVDADPVVVRTVDGAHGLVYPTLDGTRVVAIDQHERLEIQLPGDTGTYVGYLLVNGSPRPLPVGSSLDRTAGVFSWQPAAGFLGAYDLRFVATRGGESRTVAVRVVVGPSMRTMIDEPRSDTVVGQPFVVAGWTADLAATEGAGIDTVHLWAYPLDGRAPIFLGVAASRRSRPDVATVYGMPFADSGFALTVVGLRPGTYDIVVYPHRAASGTFEGAQAVRVTVR
jgi:hypothetical protein